MYTFPSIGGTVTSDAKNAAFALRMMAPLKANEVTGEWIEKMGEVITKVNDSLHNTVSQINVHNFKQHQRKVLFRHIEFAIVKLFYLEESHHYMIALYRKFVN